MYPGNTGWQFADPSGAVLVGGSRAELIARVAHFRALNKLPAGDPESEVDAYICSHNAKICDHVPLTAAPQKSLSKRVLAWLGAYAGAHGAPVGSAQASARASICSGCPHAVAYSINCSGCRGGALEVRAALLRKAPREATGAPGGCMHYGWDNAAAVGFEHAPDPGAPQACWRRG